ncbi:hypothetical protein HMH01_04255 [Halovulum dunhuangense]|uniref:Zinc finger/thioredoxin putative domain-containing protein n=1 Tax=Halovulum dunhuangense TaxID=1505036 RepID=A0A849KY29_9RHOB|nr:zinc-ribbon domain-containing protein [Halovulum dunhuangense]NNU79647.1 hypothetical protein [Halovulum dunhuangense]
MRLVCPSCGAQYEVDENLFPEEGREVQCSSCDELWVQYPVRADAPMRLEPAATEPEAPRPARPSERLPEEERSALAAAVRDEIAVRDAADTGTPTRGEPDDDLDDEAILAALRAQIAAEGGDFESDDKARSQKRNLNVAAEAAGVDLAAPDPRDAPRKWDLDENSASGAPSGRRDGLAEALRAYEQEEKSNRPRRGALGRGFRTGLVLAVLAAALVLSQNMIVSAYPPAGPVFERVNAVIAGARLEVERLFVQYGAPLIGQTETTDTAATQ